MFVFGDSMALNRRGLFLLLRLAAQNVGRRRLRSLFLGLAAMISVGAGFSAYVIGSALREGVATTFSRMGADLVVVPSATLVNITSSLLTVQPTDQDLDAALGETLRHLPGIGKVAAQRIVRAEIEGRAVNLIAYDPATDFTVQPWLAERDRAESSNDLFVGDRVPTKPGEAATICGLTFIIAARLGKTGVGPFDESYFLSFARLADAMAASRKLYRPRGGGAPSACLPDLRPDRASAFLIQLTAGASAEQARFAIGQIPGLKIVAGNPVFTAARQALASLSWGVAIFAGLLLVALLFLVSLLFSAIVQERYREIGLLRAMGARPEQITSVILTEAGLIVGLGGLVGLAFGLSLIFAFARSLGFYFISLGVPFGWPPTSAILAAAAASAAIAVAIGVAGAFFPAWRTRHAEPYAMIQSENAQ
ncbi:ABC transporter permease [Methylocapsa acidiphila]|uniref:ABC transporter permease n=1 Tax=Methylocapsa acidiphila TaxID=133552 RepID=UPI00040FE20D|nr:FtsX-like permease family protein [Methylocapsa acidiphila]